MAKMRESYLLASAGDSISFFVIESYTPIDNLAYVVHCGFWVVFRGKARRLILYFFHFGELVISIGLEYSWSA